MGNSFDNKMTYDCHGHLMEDGLTLIGNMKETLDGPCLDSLYTAT